MASWIVRSVGILIASAGGVGLAMSIGEAAAIERVLLMAVILLFGLGLVLISILAPRWRERTDVIENCLGYELKLDADGSVIVTRPRDKVEAQLYRGEITFDEYAELVAHYEFAIRGDSRRARLAHEHSDSLLLSSEYADELEKLASDISALRDEYASGAVSDEEYERQMKLLR